MDAHRDASEEAAGRGETIDDPPHIGEPRVMMRFVDARGSHWERGFDGQLNLAIPGETRPHGDALDGLR